MDFKTASGKATGILNAREQRKADAGLEVLESAAQSQAFMERALKIAADTRAFYSDMAAGVDFPVKDRAAK